MGQPIPGVSGSGGAGAGEGGSAGEAKADSVEGGAASDANADNGGDATSPGGAGGSPNACDTGYSMCSAGCMFTDGDPENCGGCNLKCPTGSLCKSGMCEVRIGYPSRFSTGEASPNQPPTPFVTAVPIALAKQSTLLRLGYLNQSTTVGAVASFGLYNDSGSKSPGALVVSAPGVTLKSPVQEIDVTNVVLVPGTYYFAVLPRDDGEPMIRTSLSDSPTTNLWIAGAGSYQNGLPASFGSLGSEAFSSHLMNVYFVVRQPGSLADF